MAVVQLDLNVFFGKDGDAIRQYCEGLWQAGQRKTAWHLYTASWVWGQLRRGRFEMAQWQCERCQQPVPLQLHHLTYEHRFWEDLEDVVAVCRPCHEFLTGLTAEAA